MKIRNIEFVGSFPQQEKCPSSQLPEYAFIGRSNVGKSSLINMLVERKNMAHTSSNPGKTQSINLFLVNESWYLADLPGYGYAKTSKSNRAKWLKMIHEYLQFRRNLYCVFILIDSRHDLQQLDKEFIDWIGSKSIPFALIYTKSDKVRPEHLETKIDNIRTDLLENWEYLPDEFISSAILKKGRNDILNFISEINNN